MFKKPTTLYPFCSFISVIDVSCGFGFFLYKKGFKYELFGVCNHSGGVLGGHYTCYVKNANGKWYHYNDTSVAEIGIIESIISPKAYCLFYRKKC